MQINSRMASDPAHPLEGPTTGTARDPTSAGTVGEHARAARSATVATASMGVPTIDPATVASWLATGRCLLIDVRESDEHAREHIQEAASAPSSSLDVQKLAELAASGRRVVMHCKSGRRSADAAARVRARLPLSAEVFSLEGGIDGWRRSGLPTVVDASVSRMSVMRQVQLTVGLGVLVGSALAWFVHPMFLIVPVVFGAGLAFAGASGTCGLALLLERMPWNRPSSQSPPPADGFGSIRDQAGPRT